MIKSAASQPIADLIDPEALQASQALIEGFQIRDRQASDFFDHGQLTLEQDIHDPVDLLALRREAHAH